MASAGSHAAAVHKSHVSWTVAVQEWLQALQAVLVQRALDAAERPNMHPETVKACLQQLEERAGLLHAELAALQALHLTRDRDARMQVGSRVLCNMLDTWRLHASGPDWLTLELC